MEDLKPNIREVLKGQIEDLCKLKHQHLILIKQVMPSFNPEIHVVTTEPCESSVLGLCIVMKTDIEDAKEKCIYCKRQISHFIF